MITRRSKRQASSDIEPSENLETPLDARELSLNESALIEWVENSSLGKRKASHDEAESSNKKKKTKVNLAASFNSSTISTGEAYDWQSTGTGLKKRLAYSLVNKILCDIHFIVGSGSQVQNISAHKYILSVGSAVFQTMFSENWSAESGEIEVPDVEPAAFWALIRFLYTDQVIITSDTVMAILYAAKKYVVPILERQCIDFLIKNLCPDNAFSLLMQARSFDEEVLVNLCLDTIDENTGDAVLSEDFPDINLETLCLVLNRDSLKISEVKLFEAVCRWSKAECARQSLPITQDSQRSVLKEALPLIRFPLMCSEQLSSSVAPLGLLSDKDLLSVFIYLASNPKPTISFNSKSRGFKELNVLTRYTTVVGGWKNSGTFEEKIGFSCNRKIQLIGIGLYGAVDGPAEYYVSTELIHSETHKIMHLEVGSYECEESTNTFRVLFRCPIKLKSHTCYIIKAKIRGPKSFYGMGGSKHVSLCLLHGGNVTMNFKTIEEGNSSVFTNVNSGQIPELLFYL